MTEKHLHSCKTYRANIADIGPKIFELWWSHLFRSRVILSEWVVSRVIVRTEWSLHLCTKDLYIVW